MKKKDKVDWKPVRPTGGRSSREVVWTPETKKPNKYVFDHPDPEARKRERERLAAVVAADRAGGEYSVETYKDRVRRNSGPVTTPEERAAVRRFKPGKTYKCVGRKKHGCAMIFHKPGIKCYWCQRKDGERAAPVESLTKKPEQVTVDSLRPSTSRNALMI